MDENQKAIKKVIEDYTLQGNAVPRDIHNFLAEARQKRLSPGEIRAFTNRLVGKSNSSRKARVSRKA